MHVHFVCSGNAYRSRLAEAYLKSKLKETNTVVSSSGIYAKIHNLDNGPICWYGMRLMKRHQLVPFMSWRERQTTRLILKQVDLLICMRQIHYDYCVQKLNYRNKPYEIWNIPDLNEMDGFVKNVTNSIEIDVNHIKLTEQTYSLITAQVNNLINRYHLI